MAVPRRKLQLVVCLSASLACMLAAAQTIGIIAPPTPSRAEQDKLLDAMGRYAEQYVSNLPNFICLQVTQQFEAGKKPNHWHRGDTLTSRLVFLRGRESRTLQLVDDKPIKPGIKRWRTPLTTEGEFGVLLGTVFGSASDASFSWSGWEMLSGNRLAVFDYSIDTAHSTLKLSFSDLARAVVPYHGSIYADPVTGAIWRITSATSEIPPEVRTKSISTTIDYGNVPIGGVAYLLPVSASVLLSTGNNNIRNEMEFLDYRKFEADSVITYSSDNDQGNAQAGNPASLPAPPKN